ncbi:hypothetical protein J0895_03430, partial [Phormidium pseudopriestleyi FRX01]|nr:hypothetical protein [Phormidium pseudopriestleyi FRX01]
MAKIPLTPLGGLLIVAAFKLGQMNPTVAIASNPEPPSPSEPPVHHIVLIELQPDVTPEEIEQTIEVDTPTLFRAWDSLRVQNLNLKGVVKAPLLTPLRLNPSVAATFLKIFA